MYCVLPFKMSLLLDEAYLLASRVEEKLARNTTSWEKMNECTYGIPLN